MLEKGMVNCRHGALAEDPGLVEIGIQPGCTLHQRLCRFPRAVEKLGRNGGLRGAAKGVTGA